MDPYVARMMDLVGERDPLAVIRETPRRLAALGPALEPERSYAPGKWTAREVLCHLADAEVANGFRLRQLLAGVGEVQPWDQEAWAVRYAGPTLPTALETFRAVRTWNLQLWESLGPADLERAAHHPERGRMTVRLYMTLNAGHDLNHLAQLEKIAQGA